MSFPARKHLLAAGALLALSGASAVRAQLINIGAAANYAGLSLTTSEFLISKSSTVVTGNLGIADNGYLNFTGGAVINGEIDAGAGANLYITGGSGATGGIVQPASLVDTAITDANSAALYYAGLTATQTLSSISGGTFAGTGGLNVIDVTGDVSLSRTNLTLTGTSSDTFVFNIDGAFNLSRSSVVLNGINPDQVLFNLIGTGTKMVTTGESNTAGIFLAQNGSIDIQGGVHDSDFIAGNTLTWESGVTVTQATTFAAVQPVPELSTSLMAAGGGGLIVLFAGLKSRSKRRTLAA